MYSGSNVLGLNLISSCLSLRNDIVKYCKVLKPVVAIPNSNLLQSQNFGLCISTSKSFQTCIHATKSEKLFWSKINTRRVKYFGFGFD